MKLKIKLTPAESDTWNWAQAAAVDFWADDEGRDDGLHFDVCPVSVAKNGAAEIENHAEVLDDMRYRLGEQLPDMANEQGAIDYRGHADRERMTAIQQIAIANRILRKLEAANGWIAPAEAPHAIKWEC